MEHRLPTELHEEAGSMISALQTAGWKVISSRFDRECLGNWFIDMTRDRQQIRLVKDRSQFIIEGPVEEIKAAGLFKAFNNMSEFRIAVLEWATPDT